MGIDPETLRLEVQCLNHYATPDPFGYDNRHNQIHDVYGDINTSEYSWSPNPSTLKPNHLHHVRPAICVITQQYSSATFVSFRFYSEKEIFDVLSTKVTTPVLFPLI